MRDDHQCDAVTTRGTLGQVHGFCARHGKRGIRANIYEARKQDMPQVHPDAPKRVFGKDKPSVISFHLDPDA